MRWGELFVKLLVAASYPELQGFRSPSLAQGPSESTESILDGQGFRVQDCSSSWGREAFLSPWKDSERAEETNDAKQGVFVKVTSNGPV